MTMPATTVAAPAAPAQTATADAKAPAQTQTPTTDVPPKTPKQIASEQWKAHTAELVAKDKAEREARDRDPKGRFQPAKGKGDASDHDQPQGDEKAQGGGAKEIPVPRKLKLKVDGQELELDEAEVIKRAQMGTAAEKRMQQAAAQAKQAQRFIELLKTNPRAVLEHPSLGVDIKRMAEEVVWEQMQRQAEESSKSPADREREAERRELDQFRKEKADREAQAKQAEKDQLKEKYRQDWTAKFQDALSQAGVPKTDWTLTRMASYMRQALSQGFKHIQPADVVEYVRNDWVAAQREMFGHLDGDDLIKMLGDDTAEKVRKAQLARFESDRSNPPPKPEADTKATEKKRYTSLESWVHKRR